MLLVERSMLAGVFAGAAGVAGTADYKLGEVVEYFSASQNAWIPAKVVAVHPTGLYDLDCKPGVAPEKIRSSAAARESALRVCPKPRAHMHMNQTRET